MRLPGSLSRATTAVFAAGLLVGAPIAGCTTSLPEVYSDFAELPFEDGWYDEDGGAFDERDAGSAVAADGPIGLVADGALPTKLRGVYFTAAEVAVWRKRARSGPYRSAGDVSSNSPGDWVRIVQKKDRFLKAPTASHLVAPKVTVFDASVVAASTAFGKDLRGPGGKFEASVQLLDAALWALVEETGANHPVGRKVLDQLFAQAREPTLDFSGSEWAKPAPDYLYPLCAALARLFIAYDYVKQWASESERSLIDSWHRRAAEYFASKLRTHRKQLFKDPDKGDYTPLKSADYKRPGYLGGPDTSRYSRGYNSVRGQTLLYVTLIGVHLEDAQVEALGTRWIEEYIRFTVYPSGWVGNFCAGDHKDLPGQGMFESLRTLGLVILAADALARAGDTTAYDHVTSRGLFGTKGGTKSIKSAITGLGKHADHQIVHYAPPPNTKKTNAMIIDLAWPTTTPMNLTTDVLLAMANLYYRDSYIRGIYRRTNKGIDAYPAKPYVAWADGWEGVRGLVPAPLLQYADTGVDPY